MLHSLQMIWHRTASVSILSLLVLFMLMMVFGAKIKAAQPAQYDQVAAMHGAGRLGTTQEVANAVVFLASPAASWVSGTNMVVDGSFTRRIQF